MGNKMHTWLRMGLFMGALALFFTSASACEDSDIGDCSDALDICDLCNDSDARSSCIDTFEECSLFKDSHTI